MTGLYLFAEGQTEQTFAHNVLSPHLANLGVVIEKTVLVSNKKGNGHRGGGGSYLPMKDDIIRFLKQVKRPGVFFTTMIDLFRIYKDFPGLQKAEELRHIPYKRIEFLERQFEQDINDSRFIPYLQLHEYEAYLFADLSDLRLHYNQPGDDKKIAALQKLADLKTPELINDTKGPSKHIIEQFPSYKFAKPVVGVEVAQLIGLDVIRNKCPHFSAWLTSLEQLGVKAP
ncbi:MAG: DUF4276 family protein [Acidobacteria bacterium]|nr:DUF4276 family protein [Acidobacteriota bacterium]